MKYKFGKRSKEHLLTVRVDLAEVAYEVMSLQIMDFAVICGHRNEERQAEAFMLGNSRVKWPGSSHNMLPSNALDFAPWVRLPSGLMGIPWDDTHSFAILGGAFLAVAHKRGVSLRYGGDWDGDGSTRDQKLMDWGHVEVRR